VVVIKIGFNKNNSNPLTVLETKSNDCNIIVKEISVMETVV